MIDNLVFEEIDRWIMIAGVHFRYKTCIVFAIVGV